MLTLSTFYVNIVNIFLKGVMMVKVIATLGLALAPLLAMSNLDVAKRSDAALSGYHDAVAQMTMTLVNANGQKSVRQMKMKTLEKEGGDKSLMEFIAPADVKGTKFLSYAHVDKDDDQWLYLPALKRVKRISSRNKSGSFMGSEFSYEDLNAFDMDKYSYEGEAQEVELKGKKFYKTWRVPKDKNSGYTKQESLVDASTFLAQETKYYDRKKELLKVATFSGYKKIDGVWRIGQIEMKNLQNDKATVLAWSNETIKTGLSDKDFNKRVLKR